LSGGFGGGRGFSLAGGGCGAVRCGVGTSCRGGAEGCGGALFFAYFFARAFRLFISVRARCSQVIAGCAVSLADRGGAAGCGAVG